MTGEAARDRYETGSIDRREESSRAGALLDTALSVEQRAELALDRAALPPLPRKLKKIILVATHLRRRTGKFDVVINGQGYVFDDSIEPSVPFRTHRAIYGFSPTFITRTSTGTVR